jgi:hypothetical protein
MINSAAVTLTHGSSVQRSIRWLGEWNGRRAGAIVMPEIFAAWIAMSLFIPVLQPRDLSCGSARGSGASRGRDRLCPLQFARHPCRRIGQGLFKELELLNDGGIILVALKSLPLGIADLVSLNKDGRDRVGSFLL